MRHAVKNNFVPINYSYISLQDQDFHEVMFGEAVGLIINLMYHLTEIILEQTM